MPGWLKRLLSGGREASRFLVEGVTDTARNVKWSAPVESSFSSSVDGRKLECQLTKDYHRVEKGLALQRPKSSFGKDVAARLKIGLESARRRGNVSSEVVANSSSALQALNEWNESGLRSHDLAPVQDRASRSTPTPVSRDFFDSRHSVRDFDPTRRVEASDLEETVSRAMGTPSVCNRQAWRVYPFSSPDAVEKVLTYQNGNAGFRHQVPAVLVVTMDMRLFAGAAERNQRWIDGGLFAMSLVWAAHSLGLSSCMLNWSMMNAQSRTLRAAIGIPPHEDIVTLIAIGHANDHHRVARSPRRSLEEVMAPLQ